MKKQVEEKNYRYLGNKNLTVEEEKLLVDRVRKIVDVIRVFEEKYSGENVSAQIRELATNSLTLRIKDEIKSNQELLHVILCDVPLKYCGVGPACVDAGLAELVNVILDDKTASTIQFPMENMNVGMMCASKGLIPQTLKALTNEKACTQQDIRGNNIGLICAKRYFMKESQRGEYEKCINLALNNEEASCQQNFIGENIGIVCAQNGIDSCVKKAITNITAFNQQDKKGNRMVDYWKNRKKSSNDLSETDQRMLLCDFDDEMYNMLDK